MWQVWAFIAPGTLRPREAVRDSVRDDVDGVFHRSARLFSLRRLPGGVELLRQLRHRDGGSSRRGSSRSSRSMCGWRSAWAWCSRCRRWSCFWPASGWSPPRFLIRHTKYAILIIFIVAAIVTPESDRRLTIPGRRADDRVVRLQHPGRLGVQEARTEGRSLTTTVIGARSCMGWRHSCRAISRDDAVSHRIVRIYLRIGLTAARMWPVLCAVAHSCTRVRLSS